MRLPPALSAAYCRAADTSGDIHEHANRLRVLAEQCDHVTEFGVRAGVSSVALLAGRPRMYVGYDVHPAPPILGALAKAAGIDYSHHVADVLAAEAIAATDLLFIDTLHTYAQLSAELSRHAGSVTRYIALHDTATYGDHDEGGGGIGLSRAIEEFLAAQPQWRLAWSVENNNGFTLLERLKT